MYADLAFGVPVPPYSPGDPQTVGVGVMDYYGGNDDRRRADEIHASYLAKMKRFTQWLVDSGYRVRLFGGDNLWDNGVVLEILEDVRAYRPDLAPDWVAAEPVSSFAELMQAIAPAGTVVATRYHNVICALKLGKPTISLGYSPKFAALMTDMGMQGFSQPADSLDVDQLIEQFTELQSRSAPLRNSLRERNAAKKQQLDQQFAYCPRCSSRLVRPPRLWWCPTRFAKALHEAGTSISFALTATSSYLFAQTLTPERSPW